MKTVKCIDVSNGGEGYLVLGQIYEVGKEYIACGMPHYQFKGSYLGWKQDRFVIVSEGIGTAIQQGPDRPSCSAPPGKRYAPDEECPCGLRAAQCTYHKGS
jgi:hypothetical protein